MLRTDRNNNPAAVTTDIARQAGLVLGQDYAQGDPFSIGTTTYYTAKFLGDPIALTLKIIDAIGYYTKNGSPRWIYMSIPTNLWKTFTAEQRKKTVQEHYFHEGGTEMLHLFKEPTHVNVTLGDNLSIEDSLKNG